MTKILALACIYQHCTPAALAALQAVIQEVAAGSFAVYLVGGALRDSLWGSPIHDLDFAVVGDAVGLATTMAQKLGVAVQTAPQFKTASFQHPQGTYCDFATTRQEIYLRPGALPIVNEAPTIEADLWRRDFSINAMAYGLSGPHRHKLIDPCCGRIDLLSKKQLKVLHPLSFYDDPSRLFRAVRFGSRFSLNQCPVTAALFEQALQNQILTKISNDRCHTEFERCCEEKKPLETFKTIHHLGLDKAILPECGFPKDFLEYFADLINQQSVGLKTLAFSTILLLGCLLKITKNNTNYRLNFPYKRLEVLSKIQETLIKEKKFNDSCFGMLKNLSLEEVFIFITLSKKKFPHCLNHLNWWQSYGRFIQSQITGHDLIQAGFLPGTQFKAALDAAWYAALRGENKKSQFDQACCILHKKTKNSLKKPTF